jgi:hypothetical protein
MKKMMIAVVGMAAMLVAVPETMAAPHGGRHHRGNDGLRLAAGIVNLVQQVINPAPVVIAPPRPVVIAPPRPIIVPQRPVKHASPRKAHKPQPPRKNNCGHRR